MKEKYANWMKYLGITKNKDSYNIEGLRVDFGDDDYFGDMTDDNYFGIMDLLKSNNSSESRPETDVEKATRELKEKAERRSKRIDDILGE